MAVATNDGRSTILSILFILDSLEYITISNAYIGGTVRKETLQSSLANAQIASKSRLNIKSRRIAIGNGRYATGLCY